jgi:hypothetical protein
VHAPVRPDTLEAVHVYRWDLDKTYLDTDFDSVRGLIRSALETAAQKRTIPGAPALVRALTHHDPTARVAIVSGSPTQLRRVLEEKLALDGVRVDSLMLKDSLGHLRKGNLRAVRGQLGYKLPYLLQQRIGLGPVVGESLFGDDAEVDAVVYAMYAEAIAGRLSDADLAQLMTFGGAYPEAIDAAQRALARVGRADAVEDVFIHLDRGTPPDRFARLGPKVIPIFSWFQAALVLFSRGRIDADGAVEVARACMADDRLGDAAMAGLTQDIVRRRHASPADAARLFETAPSLDPLRPAVNRALDRLGAPAPSAPARRPTRDDFLAFLRAAKTAS